MKEIIAPDGPIMGFFSRILDMVILSFLFLLACVPVVTAGIALSALYYSVYKAVYLRQGRPVRTFLQGLRANAKQGFAWGIGTVALTAIFVVNLWLILTNDLGGAGIVFGIIFIILLLLMLIWICYGFPLLARFETGGSRLLFTVLQLSVLHRMATFRLIIMEEMFIGGLIFGILCFPPILILWAGLFYYAKAKVLEPVLDGYLTKEKAVSH